MRPLTRRASWRIGSRSLVAPIQTTRGDASGWKGAERAELELEGRQTERRTESLFDQRRLRIGHRTDEAQRDMRRVVADPHESRRRPRDEARLQFFAGTTERAPRVVGDVDGDE